MEEVGTYHFMLPGMDAIRMIILMTIKKGSMTVEYPRSDILGARSNVYRRRGNSLFYNRQLLILGMVSLCL